MGLFKKMGHIGIQVSDLKRSMDFYRDTLGFGVEWDGDPDWANVSLGGDDLGLIANPPGKHPTHLGLRVDTFADLEAAHRRLVERGVSVDPIRGHRDGSRSFYFRDPDGYILEALWTPPTTK